MEQTLALLADLKKQDDIVPDSYIFNIAMIACSKAGRLDDVLGILQEMREMSASSGPNLANYNIAIGSCARARWGWMRLLLTQQLRAALVSRAVVAAILHAKLSANVF